MIKCLAAHRPSSTSAREWELGMRISNARDSSRRSTVSAIQMISKSAQPRCQRSARRRVALDVKIPRKSKQASYLANTLGRQATRTSRCASFCLIEPDRVKAFNLQGSVHCLK